MQSLRLGGLEKLVVRLSQELKEQGLEPHVIAYEEGELRQELEESGIKLHFWPKPHGYQPSFSVRLAKLFWKEQFDVLHTHHFNPLIYAAPGAWICNIPLVHTVHSKEHLVSSATKHRMMFRSLATLSHRVTTVNEELQQFLAQDLGLSASEMDIIRNGVDTSLFHGTYPKDALKKELGLTSQDFLLGLVARLEPEKGCEYLIDAIALLPREVHLALIGDGSQRAALEKRALETGVQHRIHFLGKRRDIPQLLAGLDLFVLSSRREGLPLAMLEAMSSGLAVVSTDVGGIPELLQDSDGGICVKACAPHQMAKAITFMQERPDTRKRMAQKGQAWVQQEYGQKEMVRRYLQSYQRAQSDYSNIRSLRAVQKIWRTWTGSDSASQTLHSNEG